MTASRPSPRPGDGAGFHRERSTRLRRHILISGLSTLALFAAVAHGQPPIFALTGTLQDIDLKKDNDALQARLDSIEVSP